MEYRELNGGNETWISYTVERKFRDEQHEFRLGKQRENGERERVSFISACLSYCCKSAVKEDKEDKGRTHYLGALLFLSAHEIVASS